MKDSPIQLGVPGGFQAPRRMVPGSLPREQIIEPLPSQTRNSNHGFCRARKYPERLQPG
jgi:hypothetical protein